LDAEKIHAGIAVGMQSMKDRGWAADLILVNPGASASRRQACCYSSNW
jgi:hypothetical protein